ncbi:hypothetical protein N5079_24890 [Planotetraspora sp. A-T 1434]|uniref:hypothetical protein n=1 Tax=Planotetraspora sp. A-T 1434 TaxID=2979219 RepID=UPI0021C13C88|nr:hypothetical protein [Planotetraspora sp. A-T 1434]MCT9933456.1 hypothetical protein [Planotetraspora sp. A-T 1434]
MVDLPDFSGFSGHDLPDVPDVPDALDPSDHLDPGASDGTDPHGSHDPYIHPDPAQHDLKFGAGQCVHCHGGRTVWISSQTEEPCWYCGGSGIAP